MKVKFEKIYEELEDKPEVAGYKLGKYYLIKHFFWNNSFSWIINTTGKSNYSEVEFSDGYKSGEIILVTSCKDGKQKLIELNNM